MKFFTFTISLLLAAATIQSVPWEGEPRPDEWWVQRHEGFKQNTAINGENITLLFYGDSITEGWGGAGKEIFDAKYTPLGTANYGIGGDRTEHLLYRIADGETDNLNPRLVVLKIGTNNGGDSTDDVVRGIRAVVDLLRERVPTAQILLLGVLPRNDANWFARVSDINIKISKFHDPTNKIHFLDMFDQFAVSWGVCDPDLYSSDLVHLETPGYQKWADTMDHLFNQLYNMK